MDDREDQLTKQFEPRLPVLFDGFRHRSTQRQRRRAIVRGLDVNRQRALVAAARAVARVRRRQDS
jgi:hypothetical protein